MDRPPSRPQAGAPRPDGAVAQRRRAVALAGHRGDEDVARAALHDPDAKVRALGLGALDRMGRLAGADLDDAAGDPDPVVRRRVAELTAGEPSPDDRAGPEPAAAERRLERLLADDDASVVEVACWAAGERASPTDDVLAALERIAREHGDPLCRESAVAALGATGDGRALPTILAALADRATVRRRAVIALAPFEGPEVEAALERHLTDRDRQVRQAAEDLVGEKRSEG